MSADMISYSGIAMTDIAQIKTLLKSGDAAEAEALCRKALETAPDDAWLSLYLATCRRLQGDEAEFRRIMLDIAPKMEALLREDPDCEAARLWRKAGAVLMEYVVLGTLVVSAVIAGVIVFGDTIKDRFAYGGPQFREHYGPAPDMQLVKTLYGPAIEIERMIEPPATNNVESVADETAATTNAVEAVSDSSREGNP